MSWKDRAIPATEQRPVAAGAAGASRGVLGTLDIVPRGLGALAHMARQVVGQAPEQYQPFTPFQTVAGLGGIGTMQPRTPAEETAAFVGEMAGSTLGPAALAGRLAGARGVIGEVLAGTGATAGGLATREAGYGELPGVLAGGLTPGAAAAGLRRAMLPTGARMAQQRAAAAARQDVPISVGQAAGGSYLEKVSETLPGGVQAKQRFAEQQAEAMGRRLEDITAGPVEPSRVAAGQEVTRGIEDWANRFRQRANELYGEVENAVPPQSIVEPTNLSRTVEELRGTGAFAGMTENPLVGRIAARLEELPEGAVSYQDAKELRSMIGRQLTTPSIIADAPRAELKRLYGSVTDDMRDTLERVGGPEARNAWRFADVYWSRGMDRIDDILEPIRRRKTPEDVFKAAMSGTREGATRIQAIRETLTPEQWDVVRRTVMRQLGEAVPSGQTFESAVEAGAEFSPERFLTNIGRISPEARGILFEGAEDLSDLTRVASGIREQERYMFNPSGTARLLTNVAAPAAGVAAFYDPSVALGIGGLAGGAYGTQRFLQSPAGLQWLTRPTSPLQLGPLGAIPRASVSQ